MYRVYPVKYDICKVYVMVLLSCLASAAPQEGFGDATKEEIAQIRAGTYQETFNENPVYAFNYKVSDDEEQVYMSRDESRDGASVTGSYSYVDPLGSLITVTYTAGDSGYSETREVQENFVKIRQKVSAPAVEVQEQISFPASSPALIPLTTPLLDIPVPAEPPVAFSGPVASPPAPVVGFSVPAASQPAPESNKPLSGASLSQSDLIAQVISQIQPLLSQTISSAVSGASGTAASVKVAPVSAPVAQPAALVQADPAPTLRLAPAPVVQISSIVEEVPVAASLPVARSSSTAPLPVARSSSLVDLFGSGDIFNVRFNTPSFNVEY